MCTQNKLDEQIAHFEELVREDLGNGKKALKVFQKKLKKLGICSEKFADELESYDVEKIAKG